jgi:DUF1707 SHOCT-like domain
MAGPGDEMAAAQDRGGLRASYADREQAIEVIKAAFVQGRLAKDEFDLRVGRALGSRTCAELAALTAGLPAGPADSGSVAVAPDATRPTGTPARTMAKAAGRTGICLLAAVALAEGAVLVGNPLLLVAASFAIIAASGFFGYGIIDAWQERRSRRQLPPRPRRDGWELEGGPPGSTGRDPAPPGARTDQTHVDLRSHRPGPERRHPSGRGSRARCGTRPMPGAV